MALELSVEAEAFLQQNNITGNIILELDGFDYLFGSVKVTKVARFGDGFSFGEGVIFGGAVADEDSKDYISFTGTTNNISVKLDQDRGGSSSITSFKIRLVDKNNELTRVFAPSVTVSDMLGLGATVYWQSVGSKHPEDSARLFVGVCSSCSFGQGWVDITIQHPETLKRTTLLPAISATLGGDITSGGSTVSFNESIEIYYEQEQTNLETYLLIDDELMKVTGDVVYPAGLPYVTVSNRGSFGTIAAAHDEDADINTFYRLKGGAIELALKIMLSNPDKLNYAVLTATAFQDVGTQIIENAIFFPLTDIAAAYGITVGDYAKVLDSTGDPDNIIAYARIISIGANSFGSYVVIDPNVILDGGGITYYGFVTETDVIATVQFRSQYNTLPFGCGMTPDQVDVEQFDYLQDTYGSQFFEYDFYIKDEINAKDFIDTQLLYPSSMFSLPRKGRVSAGIAAPPIVGPRTKTISAENVTNASSLSMTRNINQYFYNAVAYKFNEDAIEDKFLSAIVTQNNNSTNRIPISSRTLDIECGGIRNTDLNRNKIEAITERIFDRYQYGAETIQIDTNFKTGFGIEAGDTCILDGESLGLSDITNASKEFIPRVMEVTNKEINLKTGKCKLYLTDTALGALVRYGTIAPSSIIGGGTSSSIFVKQSYGSVVDGTRETDKWTDYIGQLIRVRDTEFINDETVRITGVSGAGNINVSPALTFTPLDGYILEAPAYDESDAQIMKYYKAIHAYMNKQDDEILSGGTGSFTTGQPEIYQEGAAIRIHSLDFEDDFQTTVGGVSGSTVTLEESADFTITTSHVVDLIGYLDNARSFVYY